MKKVFLAMMSGWLFILHAACPAVAEEEVVVSMRDAIRTAIDHNQSIKAMRSALAAKQEDIGIARSMLLPKIMFEEKYMRTTNPTYAFMAKLNQERFTQQDFAISALNDPDAVNDFQTAFSFEQPLLVRKANIGLAMAKKEYEAANSEYQRKREEICLKVVRAFLMVQTARQYERLAEKGVEDAMEHLRIAQLRYKNGLGLYADTLRADTALKEAEQKMVTARKNFDVAKRGLGLVLGRSGAVDAAPEELAIPVHDLKYYTETSLSRLDVKSMESRLENAKNNIRLARAGYLPTIGIGGSYQLDDHEAPLGSEGESWQLAAFLKWELFDGSKRSHERRKAVHQLAETAEYLDGLKKFVAFKVYEAYRGVEEAEENLQLAETALKTAEEGMRLVKIRYENSLTPIVDLLDSQVALDHARTTLTARRNDHQLAIVTLGYESGSILDELGFASPENNEGDQYR